MLAPPVRAFDLDDVAARAAEPPSRPIGTQKKVLTDAGRLMTYDQWRDIRSRPDQALWRPENLPFQVQFFHPGLYYDHTVQVNTVDDTGVHPVPFSATRFDYGKNDFADRIPPDIGYAGLRIHYPLKNPNYFDELIVFLGAHFAPWARQRMASRRADCRRHGRTVGEESAFTEFWLVEPEARRDPSRLYALLDSQRHRRLSVDTSRPGSKTAVEIDLRLRPSPGRFPASHH
jgi:glucans biosynthesis protein